MSFEHLNLDERLLKAVEACGFQEPTPIQQQAIPVIPVSYTHLTLPTKA